MNRGRLLCIVLLLFMLPVGSAAQSGGDAPLTLLQDAQKKGPATQNQALSSQDEQLHDIHGPVPIAEQPPYLLIAGGICLLLLAIAVLVWFLRKKSTSVQRATPPWERALNDLAEAKSLRSPAQGLFYMDRVSQILRTYIESRFAIQSTRQTTREFLHSLTGVGDSSPLRTYKPALQDCLEQADMAKFAHHLPQLDNLEQMEAAVTNFVQQTTPQPNSAKSSKPLKSPKPAAKYQRGRS